MYYYVYMHDTMFTIGIFWGHNKQLYSVPGVPLSYLWRPQHFEPLGLSDYTPLLTAGGCTIYTLILMLKDYENVHIFCPYFYIYVFCMYSQYLWLYTLTQKSQYSMLFF